jgi:protein ImuB
MPRVASLYLPNLATDRLRLIDARRRENFFSAHPEEPLSLPKWRLEGSFETGLRQAQPLLRMSGAQGSALPDPQDDPAACSCPRGGSWRPGARWARDDASAPDPSDKDAAWHDARRRKAARRAEQAAEIDALPLHQRPPMRELGRRSEAVGHPFRVMRPDEVGTNRHELRAAPPALPPPALPPMVTTHAAGPRMVIAAACPAARALGLTPGMALAHARALVAGLDVRDAAPAADEAVLERLALFAARRWTPTAAASGADGLWLDLTGVTHLFGGERAMARRILRFCERLGFTARIAVAGTAGAAHALARYARASLILCETGGEAEAIAPLPPAALRLDPPQIDATRRLGIETIGDLIASPRGPLGRRFGTGLLARLDQALGRQGEPIEPIAAFRPPSATLRFVEPIATPEPIATALADAMALLVAQLSERGLGARSLLLACIRVDGDEQHVRAGTARATRDGGHLLKLLAMRIETIDPGFGIEGVRLTATRTEPLAAQPIDGGLGGDPPAADLAPLIDRLAGRIGARNLYRVGAVESDVPERSIRPASPLGRVAEWPRGWARPARLLSPPERVEHVMAELPDHPPRRFVWRGHSHYVTRGDGPERIYGEWWRRTGEADAVRDYYQVEDEAGARFWLYRRGDGLDPRTGDLSWHLHGVFG